MAVIFHITSRAEWEAAKLTGEYRAPSLEIEGFIHCSTSDQVLLVASRFYHGQQGLALLRIETDQLKSECRYEPATEPLPGATGNDFPHIYGPINTSAVVNVLDFEPGPDGNFIMPANATGLG